MRRDPLDSAPGPSPWYIFADRPRVAPGFRWKLVPGDPGRAGTFALHAPDGSPRLLLGMYCWAMPLADGRFVVWHSDTPSVPGPAIHLLVIDAARLQPIELAAADHEQVIHRGGEVARGRVPTWLEAGRHAGALGGELAASLAPAGELLVLCNAPSAGRRSELRIVALHPGDGSVEVLPQDWWNEDERVDFGYQWITRVMRHPRTGRIIGDGIRVGRFELDATGRRLASADFPLLDPP